MGDNKKIRNVCYLICLEGIFNNGIIESQVFNMLMNIADMARLRIRLYLMIVIPIFHVNRKGITLNFLKYRKEVKRIKERMLGHNIAVIILPSLMFRFGVYLSLLNLVWFCIHSIPLIITILKYKKIDTIHCRSYISALSGVISKKVLRTGKLIFDMRGLFPEEGIIHGRWGRNSISYFLWKRIEKWLLEKSDVVISLSGTFKKYLEGMTRKDKIVTIYVGSDHDKFAIGRNRKMRTLENLGLRNKVIFAFNGGLGSWHDPNLLAKIFSHLQIAIMNSHLIIFSSYNKERLRKILERNKIDPDRYTLMEVSPSEMPLYLPACDYGIAPSLEVEDNNKETKIILDTMVGLKISEYLSSGLPIIVNENIGGISAIMESSEIGVRFNANRLDELGPRLLRIHSNYGQIRENAIDVAIRYFDLNVCVNKYIKIYEDLSVQ